MNQNALPSGFYTDQDGNQRYWDGTQWLEASSAPPKKPGKFNVKVVAVIAAVTTLLTLGIVGVTAASQQAIQDQARVKFEKRSKDIAAFFASVVTECSADSGVEYDRTNLTIDGKGEDDFFGANYFTVICLVEGAGMTPAVRSRFDNTNSLQGLLEDNWDVLDGDATVNASWSYHPNSGPSVAMELKSVFFEDFDYEKHKAVVEKMK